MIPIPERIAALPLDPVRKVPVPWFVDWIDGRPEFRAMDGRKFRQAIAQKLCWVCGQQHHGVKMTFTAGPMCGVNRTSAEPPSHLECARYSARACPFLSRPKMERRPLGEELEALAGGAHQAGHAILRNPGVTLLWVTRSYELFGDGRGGVLFQMGEPTALEWYAEGRPATRAEVEESVRTGLPLLEEIARGQAGAVEELHRMAEEFKRFYPDADFSGTRQ